MELYNNTNELITSRSSSEDIVDDKKVQPTISNKEGKLIELKDMAVKRRSRMQSTKEEFAEKVRDNIIKKLSEHDAVEIEMEDK